MPITDNTHFNVCRFEFRTAFRFAMYDDFFKDSITYKVFHDRIEFRKPTLDSKKYLKTINRYNGYEFTIHEDLNIAFGAHNLEEPEDEDVRTFYLPTQ